MVRRSVLRRLPFCAAAILACGCGSSSSGPAFSQGRPPREVEPAEVVGGFSIELPRVTLKPGEEELPCFIFPFDVTGPSLLVGGGKLTTGAGLHHGNITTRPQTGTGVRVCPAADAANGSEATDVLNGGSVLFGSSTQHVGTEWQSFPPGMAYRIKDSGFEIVARMHYLNPSSAPVTVTPRYEWYTVAESSVTQELGPFAWRRSGFSIPPHAQFSAVSTCDFPSGMHIVNVLPHMHQLGVSFDAAFLGGALDGQRFLQSPGYDPTSGVAQQYDPAIDLSQGKGVTMTCTWNNTTAETIVEGVGINEMCILFGYGYPLGKLYSAQVSGPESRECIYVAN